MEDMVADEAVAKAVAKHVVETTQDKKRVPTQPRQKGLCAALGPHVFNYSHKGAADQMRGTWEKLVYHARTKFGSDVRNELQNK